jgi:hypothetical protein
VTGVTTGPAPAAVTRGTCHCGATGWRHDGPLTDGLVCNCSLCRRVGAIWAYGHAGESITLTAPDAAMQSYVHGDRTLETLSCATCGCIIAWRGLDAAPDGRRRMAINLRLADPGAVRHLPLRRFDGADSWEQAAAPGHVIGDLWL